MSGADYLINASFWSIVVIGFVAVVSIFRDAINRPSPGDADRFTGSDQRCINTRLKQEAARRRMRKLGIKSLLEGKPGWRRINPMSEAPAAEKVVRLKQR